MECTFVQMMFAEKQLNAVGEVDWLFDGLETVLVQKPFIYCPYGGV